MLRDVDFRAVGEFAFQFFSQNAGGGETPDQLQACFGTSLDAALVGNDSIRNIAKSARYQASTVDIGESGATRTPIPAEGGRQSGDCGQQVMAA
jgi:hypothetical protein